MSDITFLLKTLRLRLINIEYENLSNSELINEIERIFVEETGQPLPGVLKVFNSRDSKTLANDESGYNGTAISLTNDKGLNEIYLISQGTTDDIDWEYNFTGIFAGKSITQATTTAYFLEEVKKKFSLENPPTVVGLSHSLAHNNNSLAQLIYGGFDEVYSVNGAPPSFYQLYFGDSKFKTAVDIEFEIGLSNPNGVYSLPPDKVKEFAKDYYIEKGENIHSDISFDDPLFGASGIRGFIQVGTTDFIDTNPEYGGIRELLKDVPDDVFESFQELAIVYAETFNKSGRDKAIEELTGIHAKYLNNGKIDKKALLDITEIGTFFDMLKDVDRKIDPLLERVKIVTTHSKSIGDSLLKANYITPAKRDLLISELDNLQSSLENVRGIYTDLMHKSPEYNAIVPAYGAAGFYIGETLDDVFNLVTEVNAIIDSANKLGEEFGDLGDTIVESHGIAEMLKALSSDNRSYVTNGHSIELVLAGNSNGQAIKVNISAALKIYEQGQSLVEEKTHLLNRLDEAIEEEIFEAYRIERLRTLQRISQIETNPQGEMTMLHEKVYAPRNSAKIISIEVHESTPPLQKVDFTETYFYLHQHIQDTHDFLHRFRKSIEDFFDKDEKIATMFKTVAR
ncbi:hypothetical protein JI666_09095 [Bacillus sp. NTK071]|uniref:DUF6792 domain-containing protein n=1 Tax=Bacillus sp. NTK071 TaxID=2802175 RepID=UPI001A8EBE78|nr:DUF6792 domain-containing protein [Bacillus sp. NTK071]MBN8208899.1 hypothetical protein [Bacillus sp. NTK071]